MDIKGMHILAYDKRSALALRDAIGQKGGAVILVEKMEQMIEYLSTTMQCDLVLINFEGYDLFRENKGGYEPEKDGKFEDKISQSRFETIMLRLTERGIRTVFFVPDQANYEYMQQWVSKVTQSHPNVCSVKEHEYIHILRTLPAAQPQPVA